ncbi:hypothetical protein [Candidatus Entotheonella palauensis]|uniref:hypothetical protein n=1 Tax=Candidatus Entotheonella palauensis TaxID=93172 RepID=UPI000B7FEC85|nr:hypothetical protein [Candidatus Entotheonella palauensis]
MSAEQLSTLIVGGAAVLSVAVARLTQRRTAHRFGVILTLVCAGIMIGFSRFWMTVRDGAEAPFPVVALAFVAVWAIVLLQLILRPQQGPPGLRLVVDGLVAGAFMGFALDVVERVAPILTAWCVAWPSCRFELLMRPLTTAGALTIAFLGGAMALGAGDAGRRFPWEYAMVFAGGLLTLTPVSPLLAELSIAKWVGLPVIGVLLAMTVVVHRICRGAFRIR